MKIKNMRLRQGMIDKLEGYCANPYSSNISLCEMYRRAIRKFFRADCKKNPEEKYFYRDTNKIMSGIKISQELGERITAITGNFTSSLEFILAWAINATENARITPSTKIEKDVVDEIVKLEEQKKYKRSVA